MEIVKRRRQYGEGDKDEESEVTNKDAPKPQTQLKRSPPESPLATAIQSGTCVDICIQKPGDLPVSSGIYSDSEIVGLYIRPMELDVSFTLNDELAPDRKDIKIFYFPRRDVEEMNGRLLEILGEPRFSRELLALNSYQHIYNSDRIQNINAQVSKLHRQLG